MYSNGSYDSALFWTIYLSVVGASIAIGLIVWAVTAFALMLFFRKVGVRPWKAWVPFYNIFEWLRVGGESGHWMWLQFVPYAGVVTSVFLLMGMYRTGRAFGKEGAGFLVLGIFLPFVWLFLLARSGEVYRPEQVPTYGAKPPLTGYGSAEGPQLA